MSTNIVIARFDEGAISTVTAKQWQYSYGQILRFVGLELPFTYEVHLSNEDFFGVSKTQMGNANGVLIPKEYYWSGGDTIYAWIYLHAGEDDGETVYKITIPLRRRSKPSEEQPTPEEKSFIEQVIVALNDGVEEATESASQAKKSAEDSEAWAVGTIDGVPVPDTDPQHNNNAYYWADKAEQSAGQAGYMFFYIDEHGHLIYERTSNVDVDFILENGHLYVEAIA